MIHRVVRFACAFVFAGAAAGQDPSFRAGTTLATLTFSVEKNGRFLTSLASSGLIVLENGKPQRFSLLGPLMREGTPIDLIVLADTSSSVTDGYAGQVEMFLRDVLAAAIGRQGMTVTALAFRDKLIRFTGPVAAMPGAERAARCLSRARADCAASLQSIALSLPANRTANTRGSSWIFEAIIATIRSVRPTAPEARRLLLVVSDGISSTSSEPRDAASIAHDESVPVYPIVVGRAQRRQQAAATAPGTAGTPPADLQSERFAQLGEMTGGRSFDLRHSAREVHEAILRTALTHAGSQFVVGYVPVLSERKIRRTVEVKLRSKSLGSIRGGKRTFVH